MKTRFLFVIVLFIAVDIFAKSIQESRFEGAVNEEPWQIFHEAAKNGDVQKIDELLRNGTDVNIKNPDNETSLFIASQNGHLNVVEVLIKNGTGVNLKNNNGSSSMMVAAKE
ncbi:ankyrin repeat domain-containing protein 29-like, partial [Contarinia nasturtii]|uniref:ankyrin repeat domain-containing protein 29-like n=1 Tax=Contarinia nasturtii TaxID=265458 RepID=UPI0012D413CB